MDLARENAYPTPFANTSLLPLLLLSLMQQKNSPSKTDSALKDEYDFIIVGAGSAGAVVASRLSEVPCVSVLLLEAGKSPPLLTDVPGLAGSFFGSDITWKYPIVPQQHTAKAMVNNQVGWLGGKALGGSSVINGMLYARGTYQDYDNWAKQGAVGWSYSDVKPYFLKAEDNQDVEYFNNGYHAVDGPLAVSRPGYHSIFQESLQDAAGSMGIKRVDFNSRHPVGIGDIQTTTKKGQRCSTAKAYLVPAENRTNLDIVTDVYVQKVLINNKKAEGVLLSYKGQLRTVRAKREVILSAGTVNTPQLLMLSGIGPKEHLDQLNIPVIADLPVGENLQDRVGSFLFYSLDSNIPNYPNKLKSNESFEEYLLHRRGPLSTFLTNPISYFSYEKNNVPDTADYEVAFLESDGSEPYYEHNLKPEIIEPYFGPYKNSSLLYCTSFVVNPRSRGSIKLKSTNPYDPPLIDPNYYGDPEDYDATAEGLKACDRFALSDPLKKFGTKSLNGSLPGCEEFYGDEDLYFKCVAKFYPVAACHRCGSVKMGDPADPTTVLGPNLKVKGISGLRVVDSSVMPTLPSSPTNVPTIMVAEKASDIIKSTLNCYTQTPV